MVLIAQALHNSAITAALIRTLYNVEVRLRRDEADGISCMPLLPPETGL